MKILFVLEYYYPNIGGVERLFNALTEYLVAQRNEVMVITNRFDRKLPKSETIEGVLVRRLDFRNRYLFTFLSLPWILKYGRKFDLVHTTSFNAALPAWIAAKILRKRSVITFHESWGRLWFKLPFINPVNKILFYLFEKLILKLDFNKFIAVSGYTRSCLINNGVKDSGIEVIYNGLDYSKTVTLKYFPPENFVFTFFGRLGPSKGIDILMKASVEFLQTHKDSVMKMIITKNPGNIFRYINRVIDQNNLFERIKLLHYLTDEELGDELSSSSCIVIPSISEGFCFAAAEAAAMAIPLISSGKGALKEVVSGKYIVMKDHTPQSFIDALKRARDQSWEETPLKKFELVDCLRSYLRLYRVTVDSLNR